MKKTLTFLALLIFSLPIISQTIIENGQNVSGTWTKSKSPYLIKGEAIVPAGQTLNIKAGTVIKFATGENIDYRDADGYKDNTFDVGFLRVKGTLNAKGKNKSMILFTHDNKYGKWGNLVFDNAESVYLDYCDIEFCQYLRAITEDDNATGAVSFINCTGIVKNTIITDSWSGINAKQGGHPQISNCVVYGNAYGIESNSDSKIKVINTIVWNNETQFYINPGASIIISYSFLQDDNLISGVYNKGNLILNSNPKMNSDFTLKTGSPCIKSGEKNVNLGIKW